MAGRRLSRGDLLLLAGLLAVAGAGVSAFLTWQWYTGGASGLCDVTNYFSCSTVRDSPYASFGGVPTATVGLAGFVVLAGLSVAALRGVDRLGPWSLDTWLLVVSVLGALVGLGLTLIEVFVIVAVCIFCVAGFALDLGILGLALVLHRRAGSTPGD